MDDLLFQKGELRAALEHQGELVRRAVDSVPEEHLRQVDIDQWVAALAEEFRANAPHGVLDGRAVSDERVEPLLGESVKRRLTPHRRVALVSRIVIAAAS